MKDIHSYLEKLRVQISECEIIRDLATKPEKRELFARLAAHFKVLAGEIEKAIDDPMPITFLGRKTVEPFPREEE
jgi:hypothetical protein